MFAKAKEFIHSLSAPPRQWPKKLAAILFVFIFASILGVGAASAYNLWYKGKVYPGVAVGQFPIGGMTAPALISFIENLNNRLAKEGVALSAKDSRGVERKIIVPTIIAGDNAVDLVHFDSAALALNALQVGRGGSFLQRLFGPLIIRIEGKNISVPVLVNKAPLISVLRGDLAGYEDKASNAGIEFDGETPKIVPEKQGMIFNYDEIADAVSARLEQLNFMPLAVSAEKFSPAINAGDAAEAMPKLSKVLDYGPLQLSFVYPESAARRDWNISIPDIKLALELRKEGGNIIFALNKDRVSAYLESMVRPYIDKEAQDAKFVVEDNKVKEFQASRAGLKMDAEKIYNDLDAAFRERNNFPATAIKVINVAASASEPNIATAEVNDLGITDVIGVGVSTFKDSHTNRIKNIANAVKRLNGILIKPGEEFSANKYAGPFTAENGFLPEQVIKGNEIKPEVGGGMCQIGTTLFRMGMNSGMNITQRRNHSLVVSYYADPVNGNPGTDATLYEPSLDLKFINDTGNYLLLQTDIDYKRQQLTFTLWGKPDGRKGWYTHPLVSKWIPPGVDTQNIMVDDGTLKVGEAKCQNSFKGAVASFTYSRITSDGQKIDRVFDSYYRPLPKICMIGVEEGICAGGGCETTTSTPKILTATKASSNTIEAAN